MNNLPGKPQLSEIDTLESFAQTLKGRARSQVLANVNHGSRTFPIRSFVFGESTDPTQPVFALFGGVHGLERIGSDVVMAYLRSFSEYAAWDQSTNEILKKMRVVFVPVINPVGIVLGQRSNGNGVDIMRNAPIDSPEPEGAWKIFRGHRISNRLPWYRGKAGAPMETETQALVDFVKKEIFPSRFAICVDVHSGFGAVDRLWYPYGTRKSEFPRTREMLSLKELLDRTLPNHVYVVEPQARQYTTHGDVWDYLFDLHAKEQSGVFLPLTLEMGSWNWLKKNFLHSFQLQALFHPLKQHRIRRVLRRHSGLFDFFAESLAESGDPKKRSALELEHAKRDVVH